MSESISLKGSLMEGLAKDEILFLFDRLLDNAYETIANYQPMPYEPDGHPDTSLSRTQLLSLLIGFCGADTNAPLTDRTHTLIYSDPVSGKCNFQTLAIPEYRQFSPFFLNIDNELSTGDIIDKTSGQLLVTTRPHARIFDASNHYFGRVDRNLRELPTAVIASPYSTCSGGCIGCSRGAVNSFSVPEHDYVERHVQKLALDYDLRGWDRQHLASVSITTGCQPSEGKELDMMLGIITEYRKRGFVNAKFHVFSYNIASQSSMDALLDAGVIGFVGTIETISDHERVRQWGNQKGSVTFQQHLERYSKARKTGFPIVETDYVVGTDSFDEMISGIQLLGSQGVAVVPNIKRNYNFLQLQSTSPDLFNMGMDYIIGGFETALATYRNGTIKRYTADLSVAWLREHGQPDADLQTLPIRHT